ncbi:hypothetical protein HDU99_010363, partial [Rhizoclosmatium hyalinum]
MEVYGTLEYPDVMLDLCAVGNLFLKEGNYATAEKLLAEALRIGEKQIGSRYHANIAAIMVIKGRVAAEKGNLGDAKQIYLECLDIQEI